MLYNKNLTNFAVEFICSRLKTKRYQKEDLVNRQIVAVVNFPRKQIGKFMGECLALGAVGEEGDVILLAPDFKIQNGLRIG